MIVTTVPPTLKKFMQIALPEYFTVTDNTGKLSTSLEQKIVTKFWPFVDKIDISYTHACDIDPEKLEIWVYSETLFVKNVKPALERYEKAVGIEFHIITYQEI